MMNKENRGVGGGGGPKSSHWDCCTLWIGSVHELPGLTLNYLRAKRVV